VYHAAQARVKEANSTVRSKEVMLADADHRPSPLPRAPWVMRMTWHDLLFAHWALPPDALRPLVPAPLSLDTFEGRAWLAVAPFHMSDVAPRGVPALPGVSAFPELNVRTYVTCAGAPGVLFFSLDAGSRLAVEAARILYRLPYYRAALSVTPEGEGVRYASRRRDRRGRPAKFRARYAPQGPVFQAAPGSLEHFLVERYCLYATAPGGRVYRADIHHAPWPLQTASATIELNTMAVAAGVTLPPTPTLLHFARRLDVVAWAPHRCMV
jgi:uncharacterized protein YqjF (DUF2071 family)